VHKGDNDDDNNNNNNNNNNSNKFTATRQLKADQSLTVKTTEPKIQRNIQRKNKEWLGQKRK
jgi:hypothetical protein